MPPASDALDGKGGGIVADAKIDPSGIVRDVVDPIRDCLAEFGDREVMHPDRFGLPLRAQLSPAMSVAPVFSPNRAVENSPVLRRGCSRIGRCVSMSRH